MMDVAKSKVVNKEIYFVRDLDLVSVNERTQRAALKAYYERYLGGH